MRIHFLLGITFVISACAGDTETRVSVDPATSSAPATTTKPSATQPAATTGTETSTPPSIGTAPATTAPRVPATMGEPVVDSVAVGTFDQPIGIAVRPNDDALYIIEQPGRIIRFSGDEGLVAADISSQVRFEGENGLLALAFSPDASKAYLDYVDTNGNSVISEFPVADDGTFNTDEERVLLELPQPYGNHNGGDLAFGPDGFLYITFGDGGAANDPERRASDPTSMFGSILRIDPSPNGDLPYTIPPDNPFATGEFDGIAGAPETWGWGLRNPWRIDFDHTNGDLWIADVGQNEFEEVNRVRQTDDRPAGYGTDFGWSAFEGAERFNDDVAESDHHVPPVHIYSHGSDGCSISGGAVYRGDDIAELEPAFVYSDFCSGIVWAFDADQERNIVLESGFDRVTAVREGPDRALYVLEQGGTIYQLVQG